MYASVLRSCLDDRNTLLHPPSDCKYETLRGLYSWANGEDCDKCRKFVSLVDRYTSAYENRFGSMDGFMKFLEYVSTHAA